MDEDGVTEEDGEEEDLDEESEEEDGLDAVLHVDSPAVASVHEGSRGITADTVGSPEDNCFAVWNSGCYMVMTFDTDTKLCTFAPLPSFAKKEEPVPLVELTLVSLRKTMKYWYGSAVIEGVTIKVSGHPNGKRSPLIKVWYPNNTLLGMIAIATAEDAWKAYTAIVKILAEMHDGTTPFSKDAFYIRRDELLM